MHTGYIVVLSANSTCHASYKQMEVAEPMTRRDHGAGSKSLEIAAFRWWLGSHVELEARPAAAAAAAAAREAATRPSAAAPAARRLQSLLSILR